MLLIFHLDSPPSVHGVVVHRLWLELRLPGLEQHAEDLRLLELVEQVRGAHFLELREVFISFFQFDQQAGDLDLEFLLCLFYVSCGEFLLFLKHVVVRLRIVNLHLFERRLLLFQR